MKNHLVIFRALADPTRLRIMLLVQQMELAVGELADLLDQSQPRISRHIRILDEAGLVERRKEGSWVFLRPGPACDDPALSTLLCTDNLIGSDEAVADRTRLAKVRTERAAKAERYFADHADEWDAIRSLHIADAEVEAAMCRMLAPFSLGHLIDVGTGTGRMIELFGPAAAQVTGIDNSPEMLRLTRAKLSGGSTAQNLPEAELTLGDFNALPIADAGADSIVMHQVLHYAQNPEVVLGEMARVLRAGGLILIADFAPHDREELRRDHAHARLGFADMSISRWMKQAGIEPVATETLEGGALTVKIWLGRKTGSIPAKARQQNEERTAA